MHVTSSQLCMQNTKGVLDIAVPCNVFCSSNIRCINSNFSPEIDSLASSAISCKALIRNGLR